MTTGPRSEPVGWILPFVMTLLIGFLPLTWVHVTAVGGFDLRLPYLMAIVLGGALCLFPRHMAVGVKHMPSAMAPWLITYGLYLLILALSLAGGPSKGMVLRQVFFLFCGGTFALGIVATGADSRALRRGGLLAIVGFIALAEFLARQVGLSWVKAIKHLLTTGDLGFVFYHFLKELFQLAAPAGTEAQASDKNAVAVALLTALFLFRAGHSGEGADRFGRLVTLLALLTLLILNTRSVLLMAAISLPLAGWIGAMRNGINSPGEFIVKSVAFLSMIVGAIIVASSDIAVVSIIEDRFSFGGESSGNRFLMYSWALERIEESPLWGTGLAEFHGQPVHNLFLGAWMHAGFFAFLLVVAAYVMVVVGWIIVVLRIISQPGFWVLPIRAEWVAVLPILPLFRVWIAGDAGHPAFAEWIALSAFFGLTLANRLARGAGYQAMVLSEEIAPGRAGRSSTFALS